MSTGGAVGGARQRRLFRHGPGGGLGAALALQGSCDAADIDVAALQRALQLQGAWLGRDIA